MENGYKITKEKQDFYHEMKNEHFHEYYEFYYLLSGERKFFLNNKIYRVKAGDIMLIPKGEIHRTTYFQEEHLNDNNERIALCFSEKLISDLRQQIGEDNFNSCFSNRHLAVPPNRRTYLENLFEKMIMEYKGVDEFSKQLCKKYCEEIVLFMIRCQRYEKEPAVTNISVEDKAIENAANYMSIHFAENITLHGIAKRYCMSDAYFSKKFKKVTGFGFKEYLNTIRMRHASDLLLTTNFTVTEIADMCGYTDSNYFGDAFRKVKHLSPREYRKTNMM